MKRFLLFCLMLLVSVGIMVGCSSDDTSTKDTGTTEEKPKTEEPKATDEVVTLNMFQFKVEIADQLQELINEFEAEHQNIKIKLETVGGGADYGAALKAKFASGQKPDIFNNGGFKELELWKEHLADLSNEPWVANLLPIGAVPTTDDDGTLYGMPVNLEGYGFIYN